MKQTQDAHPSIEKLAAYGLGRLKGNEQQALETHIASCTSCCQKLAALPPDSLAVLLQPSGNTPAALTGGETLAPNTVTPQPLDASVPADLADHPRYRVLGLLGAGGMGAVYKAEHRLMERTVALKVISKRILDNPAAVERFQREVKAAARLAHPNIVAAHDAEQVGDTHMLVMEFVNGVSLAEYVEKKGRCPWPTPAISFARPPSACSMPTNRAWCTAT